MSRRPRARPIASSLAALRESNHVDFSPGVGLRERLTALYESDIRLLMDETTNVATDASLHELSPQVRHSGVVQRKMELRTDFPGKLDAWSCR